MSGPVNDDWVSCPPGELSRLAARLRGRRQRRLLIQLSAVVAVFVIALGSGWLLWPSPKPAGEYDFAGITCSRALELADAYAAGQLSPEVREQVRQHAAQCPHCGPRFKQMGLVVRMNDNNTPRPLSDASGYACGQRTETPAPEKPGFLLGSSRWSVRTDEIS